MSENLICRSGPVDLREHAKGAAKWFIACETWMPLAAALVEIRAQKAYRLWSYRSFTAYVEEELDLKRSVASELMLAHRYLALRHPECIAPNCSAAEQIPSYANIVILARKMSRLSEDVAETLDQALFTGVIKRKAQKEAIEKALPPRARAKQPSDGEHAAQDHSQGEAPSYYQELLDVLETFFKNLEFKVLREQLTLVFDGWGEATITERRQLLARLQGLMDKLEVVQRSLLIMSDF